MDTLTATRLICEHLRLIEQGPSPWRPSYTFSKTVEVFSQFRFLDEINSFPTVLVIAGTDEMIHSLSGERRSRITYEIRGLTYDEQVEQSGEQLAEDLEHALVFLKTFDETRVESIETDMGLNAPYGAVIIKLKVVFTR